MSYGIQWRQGEAEAQIEEEHYGKGISPAHSQKTHYRHSIDLLEHKLDTGQCKDVTRAHETLKNIRGQLRRLQ